jgi:hypothetical protein
MSETKIQDAEVVNDQAVARREAGAVGAALPPEQITRAPITAAQAKVDAVAALTATAYARAATLDLSPEESDKLQADFPDEAFKPGAAGKENLLYVEHPFLRERFTQVFGMGKWAMVPRSRWAEPFKTQKGVDGSRVYVEAMLVIRGCFVAEAIGEMEYYPSNGSQNYGDAVEGAESAAFRRCAKKFGVGLQAWKKDWCDSWWARKRAAQRGPQRPAAAPPASAAPPARPAAPAPVSAPAPAAPKAATAAHRAKMIENLKAGVGQPNRQIVTEYFEKITQLIPGESLESLELRFVPSTAEQMNALADKLAGFGNGEQAARAFMPGEIEAAPASAPAAAPAAIPKQPKDDEWWREIVVVVPRKGQKRDEYLRNPDTIGSLYEARHDDDEARKRLFGFVNNYEAKPWTGNDGKVRPPNKSDVEFREALDAFKDWYDHNHP